MAGDDLIRRHDSCDYCIFEEVLNRGLREERVLQGDLERTSYLHGELVEQLCGHDEVNICNLRIAAKISNQGYYLVAQTGVVKIFVDEYNQRTGSEKDLNWGYTEWAEYRDLGGEERDSYAKRFRKLWKWGIREREERGRRRERQILSERMLYEIVVSDIEVYDSAIQFLDVLRGGPEKLSSRWGPCE